MPKRDGHTRFAGRRCGDYAQGCPTCDYWRFYDERGRFPYNFDELREFPPYREGCNGLTQPEDSP